MEKKTALVVVAHPDDEAIWCGGMLLKNKTNWDTTIISLCREDDKDRAQRFKKVCKLFNAKSYISDLDDSEQGYYKKIKIEGVIKKIQKFTNGKNYDYVFTHGENGEYGHIRHIQIHNAVKEMLTRGLLCCKKIFFFSYKKKNGICFADKNADKFIYLNNLSFSRKKYIVQNIYGFNKNSFEERCCRNIEAFKTK